MERKPVDGVMCVVWWDQGGFDPTIGYYSEEQAAWIDKATGTATKNIYHWTTLDEAKAAPELVEAGRAAMEYLCQDPSPTCCESAACRIAIGDALAKIGDTHATH
jgi:hypothetical protein